MTSLQERLQINRSSLDNWSTREQLCLAGAVSCNGDQNWVSVSRNLKLVCGSNNNEGINRPADWFSQKSCALQYANLLENVETPKRKKRSSEGNSSPSTVVETPTDSVLRRLTEERIQELKTEIRKQQEEYAKIHAELQKMQSPNISEDKLMEMWSEVEQETELQRVAEMKLENQMREREQRKLDLQRNWFTTRSGGVVATSPSSSSSLKEENNTVIDMDVEEIIGVSKPIVPIQQKTATSPLLSSLLKSPTATAPTITTLLTGGSMPNTNQPAITLNSDLIPPEKAVQLLSRPICGPPVLDVLNSAKTTTQQLLSPSQSAPTLSMLLEKNKTSEVDQQTQSNTSISKEESSQKKPEPMEIEEDVNTQRTKSENENNNIDFDEPDPNEEQQLLEVFKNIGNIELDIDVSAVIDGEEVDFLKGVDEESPNSNVDFENKIDQVQKSTTTDRLSPKEEASTKQSSANKDESEAKSTEAVSESVNLEKVETKIETSSDESNDNIPLAAVATLESKERSMMTPTIENEEKSNDNSSVKAKVESELTSGEITDENQADKAVAIKPNSPKKVDESEVDHKEGHGSNLEANEKLSKSDMVEELIAEASSDSKQELADDKPVEQEKPEEETERFATPVGDEKFNEKDLDATEKLIVQDENSKPDATRTATDNAVDNSSLDLIIPSDEPSNNAVTQIQENPSTTESVSTTDLPPPPPSHVSVADTDEDSCTTDISIITSTTKREEKPGTSSKNSRERSTSQTRKAGSHDALSKSTEDSDSSSGTRASKRSLLNILNNLSSTKSAQTLQNALNDEQLKLKYQRICYRRIDFQTTKKSIENGTIRNVVDLQRDLLQITQNIVFLYQENTPTFKAVEVFKHEMQNVRDFIFNAHEFETKTEKEVKEIRQAAGKQGRTGSRKSLRIS